MDELRAGFFYVCILFSFTSAFGVFIAPHNVNGPTDRIVDAINGGTACVCLVLSAVGLAVIRVGR